MLRQGLELEQRVNVGIADIVAICFRFRRRWLLGLLVLQSASSAVLDAYQVRNMHCLVRVCFAMRRVVAKDCISQLPHACWTLCEVPARNIAVGQGFRV